MRSIIASAVPSCGSRRMSTSCGRMERPGQLRDRADEAHHELVRRLLVELLRRAHLLDLPVVQHDDLLGDLHRLLLVVRHEHGRDVDLVVEAAQPGAQLLAHGGVERAERLVEQQHAGLHGERRGQRHALALAAGQLRRVAVREAVEVHEPEQLVHARLDLVLRAACGSSGRRPRSSATVMCLNAA
jgi:hypothetical protein